MVNTEVVPAMPKKVAQRMHKGCMGVVWVAQRLHVVVEGSPVAQKLHEVAQRLHKGCTMDISGFHTVEAEFKAYTKRSILPHGFKGNKQMKLSKLQKRGIELFQPSPIVPSSNFKF